MNKNEFIDIMKRYACKIECEIDESEYEKFYDYMNVLLEWNEKMNLTAITEPKEVVLKHFIDCITVNKFIQNANTIMDIGTGAGFPGIPLRIVNEGKNFILVDSLNKRVNFLNVVCESLKLDNVDCIHSRVEDLARNDIYREACDVVVSRAVARLNVLLEYMMPFVKVGGRCICMKGPDVDSELKDAKKAIEVFGGEVELVQKLVLPDSDIERAIVVIKKVKNISDKYPRKAGIASKSPIV